jgi:hypothetical protein
MRALAAAAAIAALVTFPSCTSEAAGEAAAAAGTYSVTIDLGDMPAAMKTQMEAMMKPGDLLLNADGTWNSSTEMMGQNMTVKGTWTLEKGKITLTATEQNGTKMEEPDVKEGTYADGAFALEMEENGQKVTMRMKKKDA